MMIQLAGIQTGKIYFSGESGQKTVRRTISEKQSRISNDARALEQSCVGRK